MQLGDDLSLYKTLTPTGHLDTDGPEIYGCHRGQFEHLNVLNAQPGFTYWYELRTPAGIRKATRQGWRVVGPDDPERQVPANDPNFSAAGLDSSLGLTEIVLCKMPESRYALRQEALHQRNLAQAAAADPAQEWEEHGQALEAQFQAFRSRGGEPFYFKRRGHGITTE